jgi:hypothetical protein
VVKVSARNGGDRPTLDANDAVSWGVNGVLSAGSTLVILALRDAGGWPFWFTILVALAGGLFVGAVTRYVNRRRRRRTASKPTV